MNILLAVDGSPYTKRMLAYLEEHKELFGANAKYTALTVIVPVPPHVTSFIGKQNLDDYYADEAQKVLEPVQAFAEKHQFELATLQRVGHAADVIAKTATAGKFDLLIMGSQGHSNVESLLLGSVTSRVMARCTTPMLVIR